MSTQRNAKKEVSFRCDDCGETFDTDFIDFNLAHAVVTDEGWKTLKSSDKWQHFCEDCQ